MSYQRSVAQATVNVGGRSISFFATHLDHTSSSLRYEQVGELSSWASSFVEPRIVAGDFNAGPDTSEIARMVGLYSDSWAQGMILGTASAYPDNPVGVHSRTRRGRIDYVFYTRGSSDLVLRRTQIPDSRDLTNPAVATRLGTLDDLGVRPSDHNHMIADFDLTISSPTPTPTPVPMTTLQLSSAGYSVNEGGLSAVVAVTRTGNTSATVTVGYATADLTAQQRGDYIRASGVLTFNPGETSKSFSVLIVDDLYVEGSEVLNLILSNPAVGAQLGSQSSAMLTVVDNDFINPTTNPLDDPQFFVRQHYLDFLNRQPDVAGFNFWVNELLSCGSNTQCLELKRINVSAAYFLSIEFQETGFLACLANKATFGALPLYEQFESDRQSLQKNFALGTPGAEAQLETNKQAYFNGVVARPEFITRYGGLSNNQYVQALINNTGVTFTSSERDTLVNGLNSGTETRATVLRKVAEKQAFKQAEFNRVFVLMQYFGYLKRDADQAGFNFWLNKLNSFNGNFVSAEMVKAFLASSEYFERFGP